MKKMSLFLAVSACGLLAAACTSTGSVSEQSDDLTDGASSSVVLEDAASSVEMDAAASSVVAE